MLKKCRDGYRRVGNRCEKIKKGFFSKSGDGTTQPNKNIRYVILGSLFILGFILVININDWGTVKPLLVSIFFFSIALYVYSIKEYQDDLVGITLKKIPISLFLGVLFAVSFHIITRYVPFLTLAYPVYPASIGEGFKSFLVNVVSPVSESVLFVGAMFAFFRNFIKKETTIGKRYFLITVVSFLFAFWHLGAYIYGVYALDVGQATTAFFSNITAFISAFVFMFTSLTVGLWKGVDKSDQSFFIASHSGVNVLRSAFSVIKFVV